MQTKNAATKFPDDQCSYLQENVYVCVLVYAFDVIITYAKHTDLNTMYLNTMYLNTMYTDLNIMYM